MKTRQELDLLVDLAKLLKKYGPETFETLASVIVTPDMAQRFADLLSYSARIARATSEKGAKSVHDLLLSLRTIEPQKYEILIKFYDDLKAKRILPTMQDIRAFISECGLPEIHQNSRQRSISPLIRALISLPVEELTGKIQSFVKYNKPKSDLEGWSNLILDRDQNPKH